KRLHDHGGVFLRAIIQQNSAAMPVCANSRPIASLAPSLEPGAPRNANSAATLSASAAIQQAKACFAASDMAVPLCRLFQGKRKNRPIATILPRLHQRAGHDAYSAC